MTRSFRSMLVATVLASLTQTAFGAPPSTATEEEKRAAQKMFEAGDGLYEGGRYADAVAAFKTSHQLVASPNSRLMLARSLRESGRNVEACEQFRGTIQDAEASGGRYPEALQAAQSELNALETLLATTESNTERGSSEVPPSTAPSSPQPETKTLAHATAVAPASPAAATQPPSGATSPLRLAAWGAAGVGVAGIAAFGVFGYLNRQSYRDLESSCSNNRCPASSADKIDLGRRYQLFANIGLGVAAVGAIAATTLFVLAPRKESPSATTATVALHVSPAALYIDGNF